MNRPLFGFRPNLQNELHRRAWEILQAVPEGQKNVSAVTAVWSYVGELIFNLLVLVGAVRMSDRIVKELLGL